MHRLILQEIVMQHAHGTAQGPTDYTATHPWRAPGSAAVIGSGCGRAGGGPMRQYDGGTGKEFGWPQNMDGSDLPALKETPPVWKAGAAVEVAWANNANHGGGCVPGTPKQPKAAAALRATPPHLMRR